MARYHGAPRGLADAEVEQVIQQNARRLEFRAVHGTIYELAKRLGVSVSLVRYCIRQRARYQKQPEIVAMMSGQPTKRAGLRAGGRGNPGKLTDAQRAIVLQWYAAYVQSGSVRGSVKRFARELRVSGATYHKCIRIKGKYKQPYRLRKPATVTLPKAPTQEPGFRRLPRGYFETQMRINAMRTWKRSTGA